MSAANPPAAAPDIPAAKPKRKTGRPKRADAPVIPWPTIDHALVFGERQIHPATNTESIKYPSIATLAERYGISKTLIWRFSQKARCYERRKEAHAETQARTDEKVIEKLSSSRALVTADVVRVVDTFVLGFERELADGKVRTDSAADLDRLVRLKELLTGGADSRQELRGGISLEAIQQRHGLLRTQSEAMTPQLTGTAANASTSDEVERRTPEVSAPWLHTPAHDADERGAADGAWEAAGARPSEGRRRAMVATEDKLDGEEGRGAARAPDERKPRTVSAVATSDALDGAKAHLDEGRRPTMDGDYHSGARTQRTVAEAMADDELDGEESANGTVH